MVATVQTVRGEVAASQLGVVLPHEHLLLDLVSNFGHQLLAFDFVLSDVDLATDEAKRFVDAGGGCIVDVTTDARIGRQPEGLLQISNALDLHVVMGCGRYRESWYGSEIDLLPATAIAEAFIHEIQFGVGDTGIRPGIIGEIGADSSFVTAKEERVLRAAARAHTSTGLSITLHSRASEVGMAQLDVLEEEGVDLRRVIVGHSDTYPHPDYHQALAERGAWVEFDTIRGMHQDVVDQRKRLVLAFIERGYADRLLLSHDICTMSGLSARGGTGYDYLLSGFRPLLEETGVAPELVTQILTTNPQKALTVGGYLT